MRNYWFGRFQWFVLLFIVVDDASGRYTTGYFWGNNYWTGSKALCDSIYRTDDYDFHIKKQGANTGLTTINGNVVTAELRHENPPFFPRFGILKVVLNETDFTPTVRASHLPLTKLLIIQILASDNTYRCLPTFVMWKRRRFYHRWVCRT